MLSIYQGKQYRVGWYIVGFGIEYDKQAFDNAGLDADNPPTTWDAFLDACDKIKASGIIPFSAGVKDGILRRVVLREHAHAGARQPEPGHRPVRR